MFATRHSVQIQPGDNMKTFLLLFLFFSSCRTSSSPASLSVSPARSQFLEYEDAIISCSGSGDWTVWRYTTNGLQVSQCGSGWGGPTSSTCIMSSLKPADSGVYWCESKHGDSSNAVNITVTVASGGSVILQSPVLPVMEGHHVPLSCQSKDSPSNLPADFYKDETFIRTEPAGTMTLHHVSRSDEGLYRCQLGQNSSPRSWLLIKGGSDPVSLTVTPDSSQLFEYETFHLSCGDDSRSRGWEVKRFSSSGGKVETCGEQWGEKSEVCSLKTAKPSDSALYWCESPTKQRSNTVNVSVYDKPVVLQSPALPVRSGANITLSCLTRDKELSKRPAAFFKDGSLFRTEPTGHMTLHPVSTSDEGLFTCQMDAHQSPPSWLFVRPSSPSDPHSAPAKLNLMSYLLKFCSFILFTVLLVSSRQESSVSRRKPSSREEEEGAEDDEAINDVTTEHQF